MAPLPQLSSITGLSQDYMNEFYVRKLYFEIESLYNKLNETEPIKNYIQYFDSNVYPEVKLLENDIRIKKLDQIVIEANKLKNYSDKDKYNQLFDDAHKIIYGY